MANGVGLWIMVFELVIMRMFLFQVWSEGQPIWRSMVSRVAIKTVQLVICHFFFANRDLWYFVSLVFYFIFNTVATVWTLSMNQMKLLLLSLRPITNKIKAMHFLFDAEIYVWCHLGQASQFDLCIHSITLIIAL